MQTKINILINKILNPLVKDFRYALLEKIIINSERIFGTNLAPDIVPYKILSFIESRESKYLLKIIVIDSSIAIKVDFQKEKILRNIAIYTGEKNITKLRISHSNDEDLSHYKPKIDLPDRTQENIFCAENRVKID